MATFTTAGLQSAKMPTAAAYSYPFLQGSFETPAGVDGMTLSTRRLTTYRLWQEGSVYVARMTTLTDDRSKTGPRDLTVSLAGFGFGAVLLAAANWTPSPTLPLVAGAVLSLCSYALLTKWIALQDHSTRLLWGLERARCFLAGEGDPGPFPKH